MPGITRTEVVDPKALADDERRACAASLYKVHASVFDGVTLEDFAKYVVDSSAQLTRILLFKNAAREVVGYFAFHIFERTLAARKTTVMRAEAGMLREYRGGSSTASFAVRQALACKLRHPTRALYYLGCLVHPSSYSLFARWTDERLWPNPRAEVPPQIRAFIDELGDLFGLARVDPRNSLVRDVGWQTRDSEVERSYWRSCAKPAARLFMRQNPGYGQGHGLLTLIPISMSLLGAVVARMAGEKLQPPLQALRARLPGARRASLAGTKIVAALQAAPLFSALPEADLQVLAQAMQAREFRSGQTVIRKGDPGDAMYLVVSGSTYIVITPDGEETLLDVQWPGEIFGEMALLTGEPRVATVRAAGPLSVLRLPRDVFQALIESRPTLRDAVWTSHVQNTLRAFLIGQPRFEGLDFDARQSYVAAARRFELSAGTPIELPQGELTFLASGTVEVEQPGGGWTAMTAPALITVTMPTRVSSTKGAMLAALPALRRL